MAKFKYRPTTEYIEYGASYEDDMLRYNKTKLTDLDIDFDEPLYLDVETHSDKLRDIRLVQLFQEHWDKVEIIDTNTWTVLQIWKCIRKAHVVAHNISFEFYCFRNDIRDQMKTNEFYAPFEKMSDTLLLSRQVVTGKVNGYSLDKVSAYVQGRDYYAEYAKSIGWFPKDVEHFKKSLQKSFLNSPKSDKRLKGMYVEQLVYSAYDVLLLPYIFKSVRDGDKENIIKSDYALLPILSKWKGLPIDIQRILEKLDSLEQEISKTHEIIPQYLNVNSYIQVRKALGGVTESDDKALSEFAADENNTERAAVAKAIKTKRGAIKLIQFLDKFKEVYETAGRYNGHAMPTTVSGRLAQTEHNLMQIPRDLKTCFGYVTDSDSVLIHADYAQLELRSICCLLGETTLYNLFMSGADLHKYVASRIYGKPEEEISKVERQVGKTANFGLNIQ